MPDTLCMLIESLRPARPDTGAMVGGPVRLNIRSVGCGWTGRRAMDDGRRMGWTRRRPSSGMLRDARTGAPTRDERKGERTEQAVAINVAGCA